MSSEQSTSIIQVKKQNFKLSSPKKNQREVHSEHSIIPSWAMDEYRNISKEFDSKFKKINRSKADF